MVREGKGSIDDSYMLFVCVNLCVTLDIVS